MPIKPKEQKIRFRSSGQLALAKRAARKERASLNRFMLGAVLEKATAVTQNGSGNLKASAGLLQAPTF